MELSILQTYRFRIQRVSPMCFLKYTRKSSELNSLEHDPTIFVRAVQILARVVQSSLYLNRWPSELSATAIYTARLQLDMSDPWPAEMQAATNYFQNDLQECHAQMMQCIGDH
eukprot:TRINITY_DN22330_c0_g1_i2.p2 TRINITY_DN22330_c0_g1~~TRINITY_DN22330_c0_g1_i2.p2  ORF type:complete len:113 (+),score=20.77 TRINITY_DN22330_c0_g1_i2:448-786(+)